MVYNKPENIILVKNLNYQVNKISLLQAREYHSSQEFKLSGEYN